MSVELCTIHLFGSLRLETSQTSVTHFRTRKIAALLGTLAYHENRSFPRDELIDIIWPDCNQESGRNRLRIALCALRQDLGSVCVQEDLLIADRLTVHLDPLQFRTDKMGFEAALRAADAASDPDAERERLQAAIDLYAGDLLPGYDERWVSGERHRLREAYLLTLRKLIRNLARAGQLDRALEVAIRAAEFDPLSEEVHRTLMRLYIALNQPAAALRQYRRMESLLRTELGIGPSSQSRELAATCREKNAVPPLPVVSPAELPPPAPIPQEPAPLAAPARTPAPTPLPTPHVSSGSRHGSAALSTPLYGRESAIADLRQMLTRPNVRLITLTGPGGIGKTSLALALQQEVADLFERSVHCVLLAELPSAEFIPEAVCLAFGVPYAKPQVWYHEIAALLSGRPALLILDNFEHLAEQGASLVQDLLAHLPALRCLVTSRQRLRLAQEHEYVVSPLVLPTADETPEALARCPSVQLFVERAQRSRPAFQLNAANAAEVAAICRRLDGIPLGIELAASWTQLLTPAQIRGRFHDHLIDLTSRLRGTPERHRSLHRVVEASCEMLSAEARQLFAVLSVFRGAFTLESIEFVHPHPQLCEGLAELMDHSLLSLREAGSENRFYLLEPLREYAALLLPEQDQRQVALKHAAYYVEYVEAMDQKLRGPETAAALQRLDGEIANIRAALERFVTHPLLGVQLTAGLWRYWYLRGQYHEGYDWLEKALSADYEGTLALRTRALRGAGNLALLAADYAAARARYEEALSLQRETGDQRSVAATLGNLGSVAGQLGDDDLAIRLHQESIEIFRLLGDRRGIALSLGNLAEAHVRLDELEIACQLHEESIKLLRDLGALDSLIIALNNLAVVQWRRGDITTGRRTLDECLNLIRAVGNRVNLARCIESYAELAVRQNRMELAAMLLGKSHALYQETDTKRTGSDNPAYDEDRERVRQRLGDATFTAAWQRGADMTDETAAQLVLKRE